MFVLNVCNITEALKILDTPPPNEEIGNPVVKAAV